MKSRPVCQSPDGSSRTVGGEKTKGQLEEDLRKTREELAAQKWGMEKTLNGMKILVREVVEAKAQDEALLDSIGDGVVAIDVQGKILFVNQAFEELLGWKQDEVVGKSIVEVIVREDEAGNQISFEERILSQVLAGKKVTTTTTTMPAFYFVRKNKTRFLVNIVVTPVIIDDKIIGAIEVFRDTTQESAIDKAKTEFISLASHQLRTPLSIARWYIEALATDKYMQKMPKQTKAYFEEVRKNNERILNLVRSLLSISLIDQGKVNDEPELTNITELVEDTIKNLSIIALKKKIKLKLQIKDAKLPLVFIDPIRLQEVIENLVANAIEYNKPLGSVTIAVDRSNTGGFLISVSDTGSGISKNEQRLLFTKFYRTEKAAISNAEGSGLGLYLVKSYVEGWGGHVSIDSKEDVGSTFTITLPSYRKKG